MSRHIRVSHLLVSSCISVQCDALHWTDDYRKQTEGDEVENVETSFEFCVLYMIDVHSLGADERRQCFVPALTHLPHLALSPENIDNLVRSLDTSVMVKIQQNSLG